MSSEIELIVFNFAKCRQDTWQGSINWLGHRWTTLFVNSLFESSNSNIGSIEGIVRHGVFLFFYFLTGSRHDDAQEGRNPRLLRKMHRTQSTVCSVLSTMSKTGRGVFWRSFPVGPQAPLVHSSRTAKTARFIQSSASISALTLSLALKMLHSSYSSFEVCRVF